ADTQRYFTALESFQTGDPETIALLVAEAAFRGVTEARWLMGEVQLVLGIWRQALGSRQGALAWKVLEDLPKQPVLSVGAIEDRFGASNTGARRALAQL